VKRKAALLIVTIAIIGALGALAHNPPSLIDVITGATAKSKPAAPAATPQRYVPAINMAMAAADNPSPVTASAPSACP
jgi:hypothetical protein